MKLHDRESVIGTSPVVYIGHRINKDKKSGEHKISRKWHAEYNHEGNKFHEPLKTTHKNKAISAAHAICQRLDRGEKRHVQKRIEWEEIQAKYLRSRETEGCSSKTLTKYTQVLNDLVAFARTENRLLPKAFTPADFWEWSHKKRERGLHPKTRVGHLTIAKQMFNWAVGEAVPKLLLENPIADVKIDVATSSPQPCFSPEQVAILLANADPDHEGPIYAVLAYLGLRIGEAAELLWSDFHFDHGDFGKVTIRRGGSDNSTKNGENRTIPINEALRKILDRLPRSEDGLVFHARPSKKYPKGDGPIKERRLLRSIKRLCKRCKFVNPDQYKLHTFRHAFASMLIRANTPYLHALELMGHGDSEILKIYVKLFDRDADKHIAGIQYKLEAPITTVNGPSRVISVDGEPSQQAAAGSREAGAALR